MYQQEERCLSQRWSVNALHGAEMINSVFLILLFCALIVLQDQSCQSKAVRGWTADGNTYKPTPLAHGTACNCSEQQHVQSAPSTNGGWGHHAPAVMQE